MAAEKKSVGHAYNVDFLNIVFAASSIVLFISTVWMVWDDFDREWKNTQRRFTQLEMEVTRAGLQQAARSVDRSRLKQLEAQRAAAEKLVQANEQKVGGLQDQLEEVENRLYRVTQDYQFTKATYDVDKYDFEAARDAGASSAERKGRHVAELAERLNELNLLVEGTTAERTALQQQLGQYTGKVNETSKQIE
ncbi:MAG: hypothetical protein ACREMA_15635, partial [Longimicrobiales bacterium]